MSNAELLNKITTGTQYTETIPIEINGETETVTIRPLSSGELSKLQVIEKKGFTMKIGMTNGKRTQVQTSNTDMDINAGEFTEHQNEALYTAIAWGLTIDDEEPITPEQIQQLPHGIPEQIFNHIIRISKLTDKDLTIIKQFRNNK
jgi:hypothetical protein